MTVAPRAPLRHAAAELRMLVAVERRNPQLRGFAELTHPAAAEREGP
jgi:hypothetical protein